MTRRIINKSNKIQEKLSTNFIFITNHSFQTRPGPRLGFQVLTGSLCRPGQFFFKNQNDVVLVKKTKVNGLQPGIAGLPGQPSFFLPYFFFNSARFQPRVGRVTGRPAGPSRVSKLYHKYFRKYINIMKKLFFLNL